MQLDGITISLTEVRDIYNFAQEMGIEEREVLENILNSEDDFEVNNYRFIDVSMIDEIQEEELKQDLYILGCFTDWFIADNTNLSLKVVQALQKAECYSDLGELMLPYVDNIQREYSSMDGYGHYFAHYDHNEHELNNVNGKDYLVFRIN